jgi:2-dehydropantoate 2-reductase
MSGQTIQSIEHISVQFEHKQEHLVFGAGLIGCYLGAVLIDRGYCCRLVCRPKIGDQLKQGVTLTDYNQHQVQISALNIISSDELAQSKAASRIDVLWLTVKCTGVAQAVLDMAPLIAKDTLILCCQNGLGSGSTVQQAFPNNPVLRVMVPFNVMAVSPGHFFRGSQGDLSIEQTPSTQAWVEQLVANLDCPLLPTTSTSQMSALLWAKLQLNLSNSVCALADIPVKAMLEQRDYRRVIALLMAELLAVADQLQIVLPKVTAVPAHKIPWILKLPNFIFTRVANKMIAVDPKVRTSMWWDLSQGKPTEIDHLNGAIVTHGQAVGLTCPANEKIVALIHQISNQDKLKGMHLPPISAQTLLQLLTSR